MFPGNLRKHLHTFDKCCANHHKELREPSSSVARTVTRSCANLRQVLREPSQGVARTFTTGCARTFPDTTCTNLHQVLRGPCLVFCTCCSSCRVASLLLLICLRLSLDVLFCSLCGVLACSLHSESWMSVEIVLSQHDIPKNCLNVAVWWLRCWAPIFFLHLNYGIRRDWWGTEDQSKVDRLAASWMWMEILRSDRGKVQHRVGKYSP